MMKRCNDGSFVSGGETTNLVSGFGLSHSKFGRRLNVVKAEGAGLGGEVAPRS